MFKKVFTSGILASGLLLLLIGCRSPQFANTEVRTHYIEINETVQEHHRIDAFLKPYREHINADLSKVLTYNPQNLDKNSAKWQNPMTNFFADVVMEIGNPVFEKRTGKQIDFCMLNYGGIRANIAQGVITARTAYEIMPFENDAIVLGLKGNILYEMADFIMKNKTSHPLSNIEIIADKENFTVKDIKIRGNSIDKEQTYYVITNDYLAKGGDRMDFFLKAEESYPLDYKLRNMFIAYFSKTGTLKPSTQPRILFE